MTTCLDLLDLAVLRSSRCFTMAGEIHLPTLIRTVVITWSGFGGELLSETSEPNIKEIPPFTDIIVRIHYMYAFSALCFRSTLRFSSSLGVNLSADFPE